MTVEAEQTSLTFVSSPSYTLGVELEFQTLDEESLNPITAPFVLVSKYGVPDDVKYGNTSKSVGFSGI